MRQILKNYILLGKLGSVSVEAANQVPPAFVLPQDHPHNFKDIKWRARAVVAGLLLLAVPFGLFFGLSHGSLAKISLAGVSIDVNTDSQVIEKRLTNAAKSYKLQLEYPDGKVQAFSLADVGLTVDAKASANHAKIVIKRSLADRLKWWQPIEIPAVIKTEEGKFDAFVATQATRIKVAPKDAGLAINNGQVSITPEAAGEGWRVRDVRAKLRENTARLDKSSLTLVPAKLQPSIRAINLQPSRAKAQAIIDQPVSFTIAGQTVVPKPADIAEWLEISPVPKARTVDVSVNSGKVLSYLDMIASWYITPPRSRLVTSTSSGHVVLDPGSNGVDIVRKEATAAAVAGQLIKNKGINLSLEVEYATYKTVEVAAADKWFVADITTKRMYAYEGTTLVRTFLISAGAPDTPTVTGQFKIYAKHASQDMRGFNADGSRYFQPQVPYVNYFYRDYAIHGNYWRPASWFGNINSSHGCVGTTVSDGAWIYDWAPIGTPVIVHD